MKQTTHVGDVIGIGYRDGERYTARLRGTARYWITDKGNKYRKDTGKRVPYSMWSTYMLDLDSVRPLADER